MDIYFDYQPSELGGQEVEVKVTHCGVCHSDVYLIDNEWGNGEYPLVPGHEIIGEVVRVGDAVFTVKPGDRVGIGWQCGSCLDCEWCEQGEEFFCHENLTTANGHFGGFADYVRAEQRFVFKIPEGLDSETAAPLLCAGSTVYSSLQFYDVRPSMHVGVIGIGGLGHLALQFADAWGCDVTAFSHTADKAVEAKSFGADHFVATEDTVEMEKMLNRLDFIISTISVSLDWDRYLSFLRPKGKLCIVGTVPNVSASSFPLLLGFKTICGNGVGQPKIIQEMLDFAARHHIKAKTQLIPMADVNTAVDIVRNNQARYRVVLHNK